MYCGPGIYLHHKGRKYHVIGLGVNTETREELVLYRPLYETGDARVCARPRANFDERVLSPDGGEHARFLAVDE